MPVVCQRALIIKTKNCEDNVCAEAVLTENGRVVTYLKDPGEPSAGSLYYGRICDRLPGSSACFVDIGLPAGPAFCDDIKEHRLGEGVICQLLAYAHDNKSPRVTFDIKLTGMLCVLLPYDSRCHVSRKLNSTERDRLQALGEQLITEEGIPGLILRTEAAGTDKKRLAEEAKGLQELWRQLYDAKYDRFGPIKIYSQVVRLILDYPAATYREIVTDSPVYAKNLCDALPALSEKIHCLRPSDFDIFAVKSVANALATLFCRRVWLKSGGNIVVEKTEAMTVIDVNSAKAADREDLAFTVNREAAEEIMRQLRLRNIGGLTVCDFIDMKDREKEEEILRLMRKLAALDSGNPRVEGFTKFGLVEIGRRRT